MKSEELIQKLCENGQELTDRLFVQHNKALYHLNELYEGRFLDQVERDKDGLGQSSSAFGQPRLIQTEIILRELGFDARIYGKRSDLYLNDHDVEVKGTFRHHTNKNYGECQSGNYSTKHNGRIHIFLKAKVDVANVKITSLQLEIHLATSDAFESSSGKLGKTNRSIFNKEKAKTVGIWEAADL